MSAELNAMQPRSTGLLEVSDFCACKGAHRAQQYHAYLNSVRFMSPKVLQLVLDQCDSVP
jgi:hypothetical protein